ncbi:hypothetical protein TNCV_3759261 [Trichonephila clavipes]|nr:hypothetical protein TNCV_3759261 [Trichonephila clavipes]
MNRYPDLVVCLKRDLQCLRPEASLVLIYRPNVAGMKGRVDLAQPVNRTPDLWCGSTTRSYSALTHGYAHQTGMRKITDKFKKGPTLTMVDTRDAKSVFIPEWIRRFKLDVKKVDLLLKMDGEDGPLHPYCNPLPGDVKKVCRAPKECIFDSIDPHNVPVIEIIIPREEPC